MPVLPALIFVHVLASPVHAERAHAALTLDYAPGPLAPRCPKEKLLHDELGRRIGYDPFASAAPARLTVTIERSKQADRVTGKIRALPPRLPELVARAALARSQRRRDLGAARAIAEVLGEHPRDQLVDRLGHVGPERARAWRGLEEDLREDRREVLPGEGRRAGEAFKQHAPEREHVGAGVEHALAAHLRRRQIAGRPEHGAGLRRPRHAGDPRDAEVEDLDPGDLILRALDRIEEILVGVVAAGASEIAGVEFQTTRLEEARAKARRRAVEAAREKALVYCTAAGVTLGLPVHIEDVNPDVLGGGGEGHATPIKPPNDDVGTLRAFDPGWISISAAVQIMYAFSTPAAEGARP